MGPIYLDELKSEAKNLSYTRIRRDGDTQWRPLESWGGFSASTGVALMTVQVVYYLEGNRVRVRRALDDQEYWYTLS